MDGLLLSTTVDRAGVHVNKRFPITLSLKRSSFFSKKSASEDWHEQIDFTAGILRPSDKNFPWVLVKKHTDIYVNKKGKLGQQEIDVRLATLIEDHDSRDVAIAACAHLMSPASVRALLNVSLNVAPASFYGLDVYLRSLIAANYANPKAVTDLEASWASALLPYATHGTGAAQSYMEGLWVVLEASNVPNMDPPSLPGICLATRRT